MRGNINMKLHPGWLAAGLILFVVMACSFSTSDTGSGPIADANMAKDNGKGEPGDQTNTFKPSDKTIHCLIKLRNPKEGTKITFSWWQLDSSGAKKGKPKDIDYTTQGSEDMVHGHLTLDDGWAVGKYRCEVSVNGNLEKTLDFVVS
jgi:hypothetical protein